MAILFSVYFVVGLASCTQGGFYYFQLLDRYAAGYSILIAVFFEAIAVSWIYGTNRFCEDIRDMIGFTPGIYWRVCWKFVAPLFLMFIIAYGLIFSAPLSYEDYGRCMQYLFFILCISNLCNLFMYPMISW